MVRRHLLRRFWYVPIWINYSGKLNITNYRIIHLSTNVLHPTEQVSQYSLSSTHVLSYLALMWWSVIYQMVNWRVVCFILENVKVLWALKIGGAQKNNCREYYCFIQISCKYKWISIIIIWNPSKYFSNESTVVAT